MQDVKNPHSPTNFGFEDKDGVEIYFKDSRNTIDLYVGAVDGRQAHWDKDGKCYTISHVLGCGLFPKGDLVPIKKPWYEIESNFPKIIVIVDSDFETEETFDIAYGYDGTNIQLSNDEVAPECTRPATKDEVMKLIVEG